MLPSSSIPLRPLPLFDHKTIPNHRPNNSYSSGFPKITENQSAVCKYSCLDLHCIVSYLLFFSPFTATSVVRIESNRYALYRAVLPNIVIVSLSQVSITFVQRLSSEKQDRIYVWSEGRTRAPLMHTIISRDAAALRFHHGGKRSP